MTLANPNILISGAGIAGPALAYWLTCYGFHPTVVERAPQPREGGYIFHLHGASGVEVLKRMGVWPRVLAERFADRESLFVDASNEPIARLDSVASAAEVEPTRGQVSIKRSDLARILYEQTADSVEYRFADSIRRLAEHPSGVDVTFSSGRTRRFDLVVGADGLHSKTRALVFGNGSHYERYLGYYVAAVTLKPYPSDYGVVRVYTESGKVVTLWGLPDGGVIAVFLWQEPNELTYGVHDVAAQKRLLSHAFAGEGWEVPQLLAAMRTAPDFYFDSVTQIRMERWSSGRVVLVGDAAYSPSLLSGYGSQLALAGAYVLAGELKAADGNYHTAFPAYEGQLRPFVTDKQKNPERAGAQFIPNSALGLWLRNQGLRLTSLPLIWRFVFKRTYGRLLQESFTLKNYETPASIH